jgi:hypothetical protein
VFAEDSEIDHFAQTIRQQFVAVKVSRHSLPPKSRIVAELMFIHTKLKTTPVSRRV